MPSTFRYASETPPAPYVLVQIATLDGVNHLDGLPAKVDTGADRTIIPRGVADSLGLDEVDRLLLMGFEGEPIELPVFIIRLTIHGLDAFNLSVAASASERYPLLGRDVLNRYSIHLDGPNQRLVIQ